VPGHLKRQTFVHVAVGIGEVDVEPVDRRRQRQPSPPYAPSMTRRTPQRPFPHAERVTTVVGEPRLARGCADTRGYA
jgi:hypothetical protein